MQNRLEESGLSARIAAILPNLDGWCSVEKGIALAECVCAVRPEVCVEIGVHAGRSLIPLALACAHLEFGHVFGIDPWSMAASLEGLQTPRDVEFWQRVDYDRIRHDCLESIQQHKLAAYCTLLRFPAERCVGLFDQIDFLHIDGNHSPESARRDVQLYLPLVPPGGQIWFDDADWESTQSAIELLRQECDVVRDYGSYIRFQKRPTDTASNPSRRRPSVECQIVATSALPPVERRILVPSSHHALGEYRGGIYNPGAIASAGRTLLLARNERFTEFDRQRQTDLWIDSCRPMMIEVDDAGQVDALYPLHLDEALRESRAEDFRLFLSDGELHAGFSRVFSPERIEHQVARVDPVKRTLGQPRRPQVDFPIEPFEKNWCYFEHENELHFLYSFRPFRLVKRIDRATFRFKTVVQGGLDAPADRSLLQSPAFISLSTSPVEFDDAHLIFFVHWRDRFRNYLHYGVLLDKATLSPTAIASHPLFSGGNAEGLHPHVVYLMSVVRTGEGYRFFLGEGDEHVSVAEMTMEQLRRYMGNSTALELTDSDATGIAREYLYEHCGLFARKVVLLPDGAIVNGGAHDSHWRIERQGTHEELWILGEGRVSCRMRREPDGVWLGTWNHGSRPQARLTPR